VIKRYNLKGPWHALRRALKPTARFRRAWLNGQRLQFLDIPTARPLALVERRFGPLRGVAYLVMEDLGDRDLGIEVAVGGLTEVRLAQVAALFRALGAAGLTHGDTKASNFLVTADGVAVIDLDAMHSSVNKSLVNKRSVNKSSVSEHPDLTRFLANFDHLPDVRARVRAALSGAGTDDGFAAPSRSL
jgi:hypothetical protein